MRVHAEKQRTIDLLLLPVQANGLTDGQDMPFIESSLEGRAAMPRRAERNPLFRNRGVRRLGIIGRDKPGHVHQHGWFSRLSRKWAHVHGTSLTCRGDVFTTVSTRLSNGLLNSTA